MASSSSSTSIFPPTTSDEILLFQFSSWYTTFAHVSIKSSIVRPLDDAFVRYLNADGVIIPKGSETGVLEANGHGCSNVHHSDEDADSADGDDTDDESEEPYAFPSLDAQIRAAIASYGAVFPKLNFSAPKDASWILPSSSPLKCTSPMDVYMLLKSSDFVSHDLDANRVFEGCSDEEAGGHGRRGASQMPKYELELVLRKWYHVDPSREFRCFVRDRRLVGITQRDTNYYDYLNSLETQRKITETIRDFWTREISGRWKNENYTFDVILTRTLESAHIVDFNPFLPRTDPLLFTYDELHALSQHNSGLPTLKVIDSRSHPSATRSSPANVHNMVPFDVLSLSEGRSMNDFENLWGEQVRVAAEGEHDEDSD